MSTSQLDLLPDATLTDKNPMVWKFGRGPEGAKCKTCDRFFVIGHRSGTYFKCELRGITRGAATDHRANWNACSKYKP